MGLWFFKEIFRDYWKSSLVLFLLIGPAKSTFFPSLLFLYFKSLKSKIKLNYAFKHLLAPTIYLCVLTFLKFYFYGENLLSHRWVNISSQIFLITIFISYFFLTRMEIKSEIKDSIIPRANKKIVVLFYSFYFFIIMIPLWRLLKSILNDLIISQMVNFNIVNIFFDIYSGLPVLLFLYFYLFGYLLFIYAFSELLILKKLFLPKDILINPNSKIRMELIHDIINIKLVNEKMFRDSKLNVEKCSEAFNLSKKELISYLRLKEKTTFNNYINRLRINEFKSLLKKKESINYDLVGLAKECGFNSKSTFFRVFKEIEGTTPNQFKKTIEHTKRYQ